MLAPIPWRLQRRCSAITKPRSGLELRAGAGGDHRTGRPPLSDTREVVVARASGGGRATHSGTDYQNRCAAWLSVRILAERDTALPFDLPAQVSLDSIHCETIQPVDDINLNTSHGGVILCQAKHTLSLETDPGSDLASSLDQFVHQFLRARSVGAAVVPVGRPFDPARDRLVIITSPGSSAPIRRDLPDVLNRLRTLAPHRRGQGLAIAGSNAAESHALTEVRTHIERIWTARAGVAPSELEIGALLELVHVLVLDVDPGGTDERDAKTVLRQSVLRHPDQADIVWAAWIANQSLRARTRTGLDRAGLQAGLLHDGIELQAVRSYREDIARLVAYTRETLDHQARFAEIQLSGTHIRMNRPCVGSLVAEAVGGSLLVVGEPGAGKSGAQYEAVQQLRNSGADVVMLAAEGLASESLSRLRDELGLEHEVVDVLDNWLGASPGYLVIDALDAARSDGVTSTLRALIERVVRRRGRWHVIASIRKFDLRYSPELRQLMPGTPAAEFRDPEFFNIRHVNVPLLEQAELEQAMAQSAELQRVVEAAGDRLRDLLRVPFNLSLVAALLESGSTAADLTPIRTQLELLDRYWDMRVIRSDRRGDGRESVLRVATEEMVRNRGLRAPRNVVARDPSASELLHEVLSASVLVEWQSPGALRPDRSLLAFAHHLLFDYGVARLMLRGEPHDVVRRLEEDPDLSMAIRPSIALHFHHLWEEDPTRGRFWDLVERIQQSIRAPEIAKTIGPTVAADLFATPDDLLPIVDRLGEGA